MFVVSLCIFNKDHVKSKQITWISAILIVSVIIAVTFISHARLDKLKTAINVTNAYNLEKEIVSYSVSTCKIDTINTDSAEVIKKTQVAIDDTTANQFDTTYVSGVVLLKDSVLVVEHKIKPNKDKLIIYELSNRVYLSTHNEILLVEEIYVPDKWSSLLLPIKENWQEVHLTAVEIEKAKSNYPKLTESWEIIK